MDFEASGIGLQKLFGLKCLRSDLVFLMMYLPVSLLVFVLQTLAGGSLPVQTLDCQNLKFEKF